MVLALTMQNFLAYITKKWVEYSLLAMSANANAIDNTQVYHSRLDRCPSVRGILYPSLRTAIEFICTSVLFFCINIVININIMCKTITDLHTFFKT